MYWTRKAQFNEDFFLVTFFQELFLTCNTAKNFIGVLISILWHDNNSILPCDMRALLRRLMMRMNNWGWERTLNHNSIGLEHNGTIINEVSFRKALGIHVSCGQWIHLRIEREMIETHKSRTVAIAPVESKLQLYRVSRRASRFRSSLIFECSIANRHIHSPWLLFLYK